MDFRDVVRDYQQILGEAVEYDPTSMFDAGLVPTAGLVFNHGLDPISVQANRVIGISNKQYNEYSRRIEDLDQKIGKAERTNRENREYQDLRRRALLDSENAARAREQALQSLQQQQDASAAHRRRLAAASMNIDFG